MLFLNLYGYREAAESGESGTIKNPSKTHEKEKETRTLKQWKMGLNHAYHDIVYFSYRCINSQKAKNEFKNCIPVFHDSLRNATSGKSVNTVTYL